MYNIKINAETIVTILLIKSGQLKIIEIVIFIHKNNSAIKPIYKSKLHAVKKILNSVPYIFPIYSFHEKAILVITILGTKKNVTKKYIAGIIKAKEIKTGSPLIYICCTSFINIVAETIVATIDIIKTTSESLLFFPNTASLTSQHFRLLINPKTTFATKNTEIKNISKFPILFTNVFVSIKIYRIY